MSEGETRSHVPFLETTLAHYRQDGHVQTSITVFLAGCTWHRFSSLGKGPIQRLVIVRNYWKCIPYSGKFSREKTFVNFVVLWLNLKVFSAKSYFSPICKSFLPQKFTAIQYKAISVIFMYIYLKSLYSECHTHEL